MSVYAVSSTGGLTEQPNSPYAIAAPNPVSVLAVNTNPVGGNTGGVFVYVGNSDANGGDLNPFLLCTVVGNGGCKIQDVQNNLLAPLQEQCSQPPCKTVPPTAVGQNPLALVVDPTNNFLYVASEGANTVYGFRINTSAGTLAPLSPANQPTGSQPSLNRPPPQREQYWPVPLHLKQCLGQYFWIYAEHNHWIHEQSDYSDHLSAHADRTNRALNANRGIGDRKPPRREVFDRPMTRW